MRAFFTVFIVFLTLATPGFAAGWSDPLNPYSARQGAQLSSIVDRAKSGRWSAARSTAAGFGDPAALTMVDWLRAQSPDASYRDAAEWLALHRDWPLESTIQRRGEEEMPGATPPEQVLAFFAGRKPKTARGAYLLAQALERTGRGAEARPIIIDAWVNDNMAPAEEADFRNRYASVIRPHHAARLDRLLWDRRTKEAERMLRDVPADIAALAQARIALIRKDPGVDGMIKRVPAALRNDPGLAYARMRWRHEKDRRRDAEAMMIEASQRKGALGRPDKWADERRLFAREAFEDGDPRRAYRIANNHGLTEGVHFAELEWFAGWIALRKLNDPRAAYRHFQTLWGGVNFPVSRARAAYWAGEAAEKLGDHKGATVWRHRAAQFGTAYYGQLAAERLRLGAPSTISAMPQPKPAAPVNSAMVRVGLALQAAGEHKDATRFFVAAAEQTVDPTAIKLLGRAALRANAPHIAVDVGKKASQNGVILAEISFPTVPMPQGGNCGHAEPEMALALAIARQESEFDARAVSRSGARGLMQLMPRTAQLVAAKTGQRYDLGRLGSDPHYNARMGMCYLGELLERFDGSLPLAIASYNAGPTRVSEWIERFGDPRRGVDPVDWAETIPYSETRNYVQRVLEGMHVYRARLGG